jgi:hypothetical protein
VTTESNGAADTRASAVRDAVADMLAGSGLEIRELDHGLVIVNPSDPDRGQVHVAYADCNVSWERVTWDYWGVLEGFENDDDTKTTATRIIDTLTAR